MSVLVAEGGHQLVAQQPAGFLGVARVRRPDLADQVGGGRRAGVGCDESFLDLVPELVVESAPCQQRAETAADGAAASRQAIGQ